MAPLPRSQDSGLVDSNARQRAAPPARPCVLLSPNEGRAGGATLDQASHHQADFRRPTQYSSTPAPTITAVEPSTLRTVNAGVLSPAGGRQASTMLVTTVRKPSVPRTTATGPPPGVRRTSGPAGPPCTRTQRRLILASGENDAHHPRRARTAYAR